jgi:zinc-ribbon domain
MYCPNCGVENDDGNRFCVGCGSTLSKRSPATQATPVSFRKRVGRLLGTTRRARLLSAITAGAIAVAISAFVALEPGSESAAEDPFLLEIDRICVAEKERISSLELETLRQRPPNVEEFASVLVTIVAEWRSNLESTPPAPIHAQGIQALDSALREVLIGAGGLARVVRDESPGSIVNAQAQSIDKASAEVDRAIGELGLTRCEGIAVEPAGASGP